MKVALIMEIRSRRKLFKENETKIWNTNSEKINISWSSRGSSHNIWVWVETILDRSLPGGGFGGGSGMNTVLKIGTGFL